MSITGFGNLTMDQKKSWVSTSNVIPMISMLAGLLVFWGTMSSAQTRQEERTAVLQKEIAKLELNQQQVRSDIKEELKSITVKLEKTEQSLFYIQQTLIQIQQSKPNK
jgi:septal ring factor EnvC (AmiA/AmiB activator)